MPSKRERKPIPQASASGGERIAKVMARAGLCSRREAEAWIAAGRVSVNGAKIASPALNVSPRDRVLVDGEPLPQRERTRLFLYNKPRGLVTTNADPEGRTTIFSALPKGLPRLVTVGRLDMNTEGLLLLTNDGGLARVLELPETGWLRRYRVRAHGNITQPQLDALRKGITIDGIRYGEIVATLDRAQGANVWLTFAIREGKNREVRNVLEHLGLKVNRLIRVSYGPFQLGDLADGAVEEIRTRHLREQLGTRIAEAAGADFSGPISVAPPERDLGGHERDEKSRHPEVRAKRASKDDGPTSRPIIRRGPRFARAPQDDGERQSRTSLLPRTEAKRHGRNANRRGPEGVGQKKPEKRRHPEAAAKRPPERGAGHPSARLGLLASRDDGKRKKRPRRHGPFRAPSGGKRKR